MKPKFFLLSDSESECHAIYDEKGNFIIGWQEGDDISRVFKNFFNAVGFDFEKKSFSIDGDFPKRI